MRAIRHSIPTTIIYLSLDDTYDIYDTLLTISMPGTSLAVGASVSDSVTVSIPSNLASGTYYFHVGTMFGLEDSGPNTDYQLTVTSN
jgi:hypothetical protein